MIIVGLILLGLCLGSFVNALVWRVYQQAQEHKKQQPNPKHLQKLSILNGRSMCTSCGHELAAKDLIPVLSWTSTGGKCRYCHGKISPQYPIVEVATSTLFIASYIWWPKELEGTQTVIFGLWLLLATGLMALLVYDLKWYLLPNRIVYPLSGLAGAIAIINVATASNHLEVALNTVVSVVVGGGIFYVLFQVSGGKWIGGGDVKLGWLLGLSLGTPGKSLLMIFIAALLGSLVSVPLIANKKLKKSSVIPFGPFLIMAAFFVQLFGQEILDWYQHTILML